MLTRRPDDIYPGRGWRMTFHHFHQFAHSQIIFDEVVRQHGDSQSGRRGDSKSNSVIGLELSLRTNGYHPVSVHHLPGFRALHESLMSHKFFGCLRRAVDLDVIRAGNKNSIERTDASGDEA